jgi:hypothetical protein
VHGVRLTTLAAVAAVVLAWAAPAQAAPEFRVLFPTAIGCADGGFGMRVLRSGLGGEAHTAHTVVRAGGKVYMNEDASVTTDGEEDWNLYDLFNYGPTANKGTWPLPQRTLLRVELTLEKPKGTVLFAWTSVFDSCSSGKVVYNGLTADDADKDLVPLPLDKCPNRAATTADGCPERSLAIASEGPGRVLIGWLSAKGFPQLSARRTVTIWKVRTGADKRVGQTRTTVRGNFRFALREAGVFYATTGAVGAVSAVRSLNLRVR